LLTGWRKPCDFILLQWHVGMCKCSNMVTCTIKTQVLISKFQIVTSTITFHHHLDETRHIINSVSHTYSHNIHPSVMQASQRFTGRSMKQLRFYPHMSLPIHIHSHVKFSKRSYSCSFLCSLILLHPLIKPPVMFSLSSI